MSRSPLSRRAFLTTAVAGAATVTGLSVALSPTEAFAFLQQNRRKKNNRNNKNRNRKPPEPTNPVLSQAFGNKWKEANLNAAQQQQLSVLVLQTAQASANLEKQIADVYTREQRDLLERAYTQAVRAGVKAENIPKRVEEARKTLQLSIDQQEKMKELKQQQQLLKSQVRAAAEKILNKQQVTKLFGGD